MPYRYGSYQFYRADNQSKQFDFNSFVNLTSSGSSVYFPQFMYESILRVATGNPDLNYTLTTVPYPILAVVEAREVEGSQILFCFMVGVALAMIPCAMISFVLKERMENLKHMQLVSGMSLPAYWISNMIADIIKMYIPVGLIIGISVLLNCNYPGVWAVFLALPWGLVPFTYLTSFLFSTDTNAQITTLVVNFMICDIFASVVYTLQC